jgi:short-subunit dehydrogenase
VQQHEITNVDLNFIVNLIEIQLRIIHKGTLNMNATKLDKVIVITGASSGFGKGMARKFAQSSCSLVLAARRIQLLQELAEECQAIGVRAIAVPVDVSKQDDVADLAKQVFEKFGRIDIWINNAGVGAIGLFEEIPLEDHHQVIATNLLGTLYGSFHAMQLFHKQGHGILINVSSVLGKIPAPYYSSYTAAKFGIVGLDSVLRQELRQNDVKDIHVCTVMPMANDTPFFDHAANYTGHEPQPVPPLYDPQGVIDTVFELVLRPKDEVIVGGVGSIVNAAHHVTPGLIEKIMASQTHDLQMRKAGPAPATSGAVREPNSLGTEVRAGRLKSKN